MQVASAQRAVDDAVVAGHGDPHTPADRERAVDHHRLLLERADREDRGGWGVDDGGEVLDAHHAEVGDGEARAGVLGLLKLAVTGPSDEI